MADVLLTHSYHLPYDAKQLEKMQPYLPLGTLYAASALRESGIATEVFDVMLEAPERFREALKRSGARVVVVYEDDFNFLSKMCLTRMREVAWAMASAAKMAGAVAIVHGSDATDHTELFLSQGFDFVLCGEAEALLVELCGALLDGREMPVRDGLVSRDSLEVFLRGPRRLARNGAWSKLGQPARELVDMEPYRVKWTAAHARFSTNLVASRGCPFRCNWCAKPISGDRFQLRTAAAVAEEMLQLKRAGVDHLWFSDDVFALNHHWVGEFAAEVTKRDAALPFKIQSRADLMREDTVRHLAMAGCEEVWMGVESGSQAILDAMDKGITLAQVAVARQRLREAGVRACFFLQFGYPGETWVELQKTIELVRRLRPDEIGISFSYPLPGTVFYQRVQSQLGAKRNWTDSDDLSIMFKAAYSTEFYRSVRAALHAEVKSWSEPAAPDSVAALWRVVEQMEPESRTPDAFRFDEIVAAPLVSIDGLTISNAVCG